MSSTTRARCALAGALLILSVPRNAAACAVCLGSAFGDRSYTWPYLGLILMRSSWRRPSSACSRGTSGGGRAISRPA